MSRNSLSLSFVTSACFILLGVLVLLLGMGLVAQWCNDVWASSLDVLFVALGLILITRTLRIPQIVGNKTTTVFIVWIVCLTLFSIVFSKANVFVVGEGDHLLSFHNEHNLTFNRMLELSHALKNESINAAHSLAITYGQYAYTYLYSSLIYMFGGDVITHICVWNGMHLGIVSILCVLIAAAMDIRDKGSLKCILLLASLQPSYMTLFAYNRNIIGEAFLLLGLLMFVKSYKKPIKLLLMLPIYGFLFYAFRLQYVMVAICMMLIILIVPRSKRQSLNVIGIFVVFFVLTFLYLNVNWQIDVEEGLNVDNYTRAYGGNYIKELSLGLIGKFPWTNWFFDDNWTYHLFVSLQAPMMFVLYYYVYKENKGNLKKLIFNPVLLCAVFLLSAGLISSTHTTYLAVAAPMLVIGVSKVGLPKIFNSYLKISMVYIVLSLVWFLFGLSGTGVISGQ